MGLEIPISFTFNALNGFLSPELSTKLAPTFKVHLAEVNVVLFSSGAVCACANTLKKKKIKKV